MDKNKIKNFAILARRNLMESIIDKAFKIGVEKNKIHDIYVVEGGFKLRYKDEIFNINPVHREVLLEEIEARGFTNVIEEVAYTWFNRFIAIRYMEVNEYLPIGIRVLSSESKDKIEPDVLTRISETIQELNLDASYIYELLDSGKREDREVVYKSILVKQCNKLGRIMPEIFEKISDYTELLLPENLLEEDSIIRSMVEQIDEEDFKEGVEIIGWIYQYYISEKKDEVFDGLKKNIKITKENIPVATQLFTPKWIVRYMVENSLGRLWNYAHPNSELKKELEFYIVESPQDKVVQDEIDSIKDDYRNLNLEDIKLLDPCMGSGHILIYAFDMFYKMYESSGYSEREIPRMILKNNIYGVDIDKRALQLSYFALIMKARSYNRKFFKEMEKENLELNLCIVEEGNEIQGEIISYFAKGNEELRIDLEYLIERFSCGKEYGSMIKLNKINFDNLENRLLEIQEEEKLTFYDYRAIILNKLPMLLKQGKIISEKYDICITNPPYMGIRGMNDGLVNYLSREYELSKYDLFSVYMEVCNNFNKENGLSAIINQHSWMFLSSFEHLRETFDNNITFINMIHLGAKAFEENVGTIVQNVAYVARKHKNNSYSTKVIDLRESNNSSDKEKRLKEIIKKDITEDVYNIVLNDLFIIPGKPFAYWVRENILRIFKSNESLGSMVKPRQGMATSDNKRFLREWFEVDYGKIKFNSKNSSDALISGKKWFPYNKGGSFRKWYGNNEFVINWEKNGEEVKEYAAKLYKSYSRTIKNEDFYFKKGLTYTFISENMGVRYSPEGFIFDVAGSSVFFHSEEKVNVILSFLCSKISKLFLDIMNPTYNIQVGDIKNIPIKKEIFSKENLEIINRLTMENIELSRKEWDNFELSWDFKTHPLVRLREKCKTSINIEEVFSLWQEESQGIFTKVKENEENLNKILIDIYGLSKELDYKQEDRNITIRRSNRERDIKSLLSYAIGCIFGRYSIDKEGLLYGVEELNPSVLVVLDDEYFEDDIVSKVINIIRIFYGEKTLEDNLDYIAESISKKTSDTSRNTLRKYFLKDFYKDHIKMYKKKPIYWMFESGKNDGFKALIYAHRYNKSTIAKLRINYLHILQKKYESQVNNLKLVAEAQQYGSRDIVLAKKNIDKILKQIEECKNYDKVVEHLASEEISIELDEGIKSNYNKFQGVKIINNKGKEENMNLFSKL